MRISDQLVATVLFVSQGSMENPEKARDYRGTAFIVSVPSEDGMGEILHIVTAKHVANSIPMGEAIFAVNARDGFPRWMLSGNTPWFYHPDDETVDVAVMPMASANIHQYVYRSIPVSLFASAEQITALNIGLGDEIASVGLFRPFHGDGLMLEPIVRLGSIAMMPSARVPNTRFGSIEAYLAEGRSIGGLSGSPVFVRPTVSLSYQFGSQVTAQVSGAGGTLLLGLIHGHYDSPADRLMEPSGSINMGVSIIVPARKILEVMFSPVLVAMRKQAQMQWQHIAEESHD